MAHDGWRAGLVTEAVHILVVDDDWRIRDLVRDYLTKHGFRVSTADGGGEMRDVLGREPADLIVLDLTMPKEHGFDLVVEIRKTSEAGIIILTGADDSVDQVVGLELGADDYIAKPCEMRELLARVRSVLRRVRHVSGEAPEADRSVLEFDGWRLDQTGRRLTASDGSNVTLTSAEFDLLAALAGSSNRVLSRDQLLDITQTRGWTSFDRSVDSLVSRLRKKIEDDPRDPKLIKTVRNVGYVFSCEVKRS